MENRQKFFIHILSSAFEKKSIDFVPDNLDWDKLFYAAQKHKVAHLFYDVLKRSEISLEKDIEEKFLKAQKSTLKKSAVFDAELEYISEAFSDNKIKFLPLKGAVIKKLYPDPSMRTMSDLDILLFEKDRKKAKEIMLSSGYEITLDDVTHEDVFLKPPLLNIELHYSPVPIDHSEYNYYKNKISQLLNPENPWFYEDQYIFLIVHTAKHFRNGGIGVRAIADIFFFNQHDFSDKNYIENELKKLSLSDFEKQMKKLGNMWFAGGEENDDLKLIGNYILGSGAFGLNKQLTLSNKKVQNGSKNSFIFSRIFPSKNKMVSAYPSLKRFPFLLPVFWVTRIFNAFFFKKDKLKSDIKSVQNINNNNVENLEKVLEKSGLKGD